MVALLSPDAKASKWVAKEISYAERLGLTIIPTVVRGTDLEAIPFLLNDFQYIDLRFLPDEKIAELVAVVRGKLSERSNAKVTREKTFWEQLFDKSRGKLACSPKLRPALRTLSLPGRAKLDFITNTTSIEKLRHLTSISTLESRTKTKCCLISFLSIRKLLRPTLANHSNGGA